MNCTIGIFHLFVVLYILRFFYFCSVHLSSCFSCLVFSCRIGFTFAHRAHAAKKTRFECYSFRKQVKHCDLRYCGLHKVVHCFGISSVGSFEIHSLLSLFHEIIDWRKTDEADTRSDFGYLQLLFIWKFLFIMNFTEWSTPKYRSSFELRAVCTFSISVFPHAELNVWCM